MYRIPSSFFGMLIALLAGCSNPQSAADAHDEVAATEKRADVAEEAGETIASLSPGQIKAVGITLGPLENKNLTATIKTNGELRVPNNKKANATSLYGGVIKTLHVQLGDYVKQGQVIATIANPQFIQLQEEYLSIHSRILLAQQEAKRQQELNEGNAGALKNLQSANAELNVLLARKASLQKQILLMGINPASVTAANLKSALTVTSPISGTVSNEFAKIGSYVDVSSPVVEIVDNSLLHLDLHVFEKDLAQVKIGQAVSFTLTNNPQQMYSATVYNIGASFENESKTIAVHAKVSGNRAGLIDGMNVTALVSIGTQNMPAVPNDAIVAADGKFYIFVETQEAPHAHEESNKEHGHDEEQKTGKEKLLHFEKIEIVKSVSEMGYTAITPVKPIAANSRIVTRGAFFINAKLANTGGHQH